jgi:hypothetical protein
MPTSFHHLANIISFLSRDRLLIIVGMENDEKLSKKAHWGGILKNSNEIVNRDLKGFERKG